MNQLNAEQLHQHVAIVAWLQILSNAIMLVIGCFVFFLLGGIGAATGEDIALRVLVVVGTGVAILLFVLAIPGIVAGVGLLRREAWGRILGVVVGVLGLINFPIGTAIGAYTIWVLLQDSAGAYFSPMPQTPA